MSVKQGKDVYIVVMTDGRNSHKILLSIEKDPSPHELKVIRRNESICAAQILGVRDDHLIFLEFEDGSLASNYQNAKQVVLKCLVKLMPSTIFMPDESDAHQDHKSASAIISDAVRESKLSPLTYSYVVWATDGPRKGRASNEIDVDVSNFFSLKCEAIEAYKSQVTRLFESQSRPVLDKSMLSRFTLPTERFMMLNSGPAKSSER